MKIASLTLENFKRFEDLHIDFRNGLTKDIANRFLILGDNGMGKTTVLQAIALTLSIASGRTDCIENFKWPGWLPDRFFRGGKPRVELEVHFTDQEIKSTRNAWRLAAGAGKLDESKPEPGEQKIVRLVLDGDKCYVDEGGEEALRQFRGRSYAASVMRNDLEALLLFDESPGVFWFDQFRSCGSHSIKTIHQYETQWDENVSFQMGVAQLRDYLNKWQLGRMAKGSLPTEAHGLEKLEEIYKRIFPNRSFCDPEPFYRGNVPSPAGYYFMLSDGNRTYDIEEMSAGEQAIFPMLIEFVRQGINNSVVLIDEIDLNLHPPLAQALFSSLFHLGQGCQFIATTHSEVISSAGSPEQIYRLPGGRLCL